MTQATNISKLDILKEVYNDKERKSIFKILYELLSLSIYYKTNPKHYFTRYLFKKDKTNIKDYFPNSILYNLKPYFNDQSVIEFVENKLFFDFFYGQFNLNLPNVLMYNHKNMFVVSGESVKIKNIEDFKELLIKVFKQNSLSESIFIKKTYKSYGGNNIYKLFSNQLNSDPELIKELYLKIIKDGYLFQKTIIQHPELDRINPSCINTIRIDTFIDKDGEVETISGFLKMSISNSHVDNMAIGGCQVGIDIESGKLNKNGYKVINNGVSRLTSHPITNEVFENFKIPYFNEVKQIVIKAASLMPALRLIGWDVAISKSGPIIVEGNSDYGMEGNDLAIEGYRSSPVFRKLLEEIKSSNLKIK